MENVNRLERGLAIMAETKKQVDYIKADVEQTSKVVAIEKEKTQVLIDEVEEETAKANVEEEAASVIADRTKIIKDAADAKKKEVDAALAAAIPAMEAAKNAVKGLSVKSIGEMKGFGTPPAGVPDVGKCVFILKGEYSAKKQEWPMVQNMMKDPAKFMTMLETYNKEAIPDRALELLKPIMAQDFFNEETMMKKSSAAANICKWVIAVVTYNGIYRNTKPLMDAAAEAEGIATEKGRELDEVMAKLQIVRDRVAALNAKLATAKASLKEVMDKQDALMAQLGLAQRLVDGLADEQIRWT